MRSPGLICLKVQNDLIPVLPVRPHSLKPVTMHKRVLEKHPEVSDEDIPVILGTLYKSEDILPTNKDHPYFNFIARFGEDRSGILLLDVQETKDGFEVVNAHWIWDFCGQMSANSEPAGKSVQNLTVGLG